MSEKVIIVGVFDDNNIVNSDDDMVVFFLSCGLIVYGKEKFDILVLGVNIIFFCFLNFYIDKF